MSNPAPITLAQLFRFKRPWGELPLQDAAVEELSKALSEPGAVYSEIMRRDQPWFHTWSQDGKQPVQPSWLIPARSIVKEYEGCRLTSYLCPAKVWTIGWGRTGPEVREGMTITQSQADTWLDQDLNRFANGIHVLLPGADKLGGNQQAALISWAFNVGLGAVENSTLRRRIQSGKSYQIVVREELPRWNKGAKGEVLPGLVRRRAAEVALFVDGEQPQPSQPANPLAVPYYAQLDSATDQGRRMCFSSSCAMLLEAIKPGTLKGANGDDQYLAVVQRFGDTTDADVQIRALAFFGVTALLVQNADFQLLEQQINRGIPVPCGYIHRGPVERPTGSGHWLLVYGHTPTQVVVNDPWGEPDLINGTTLNANGMGLRFSRLNFGKRWMVEPIGGGAYRYAPGKGWAIVVKR